jgi:hypothetical protein
MELFIAGIELLCVIGYFVAIEWEPKPVRAAGVCSVRQPVQDRLSASGVVTADDPSPSRAGQYPRPARGLTNEV